MSATTFRQAVQDALQDAYGATFVAGDHEGPSPERDLGCVWLRGKQEWPQDVMIEEVFLGVRVFVQWKQQEGQTAGQNEPALEAALELLQTTLRPLRTTLGPWMFRVQELSIDRAQSAVEATVVGYQTNLSGG